MTDPSSPNYQLAQSNPDPTVPPDHPFKPPESTCSHVMFHLESGWPVICGLPRRAHEPPPPKFPPDEARDV